MVTEKAISAQRPASPPPLTRPTFGQLWQVPLFFAGLLTLVAVWATRPVWHDPEARQLELDLALARRLLQDPKAAPNEVPGLLVDALNRIDRSPARAGEAHFLLGSAYLRLADPLPAKRALDLRQEARFHLEQAETLGVPEPDRASLAYRLGKVWYQTGGDPMRIILYLHQSIERAADDRSEGYAMLAQTYLRPPVQDLQAALQANDKLLQLPTADENLLAPARLLRGEILLRLHEREAARKALARIEPGAPPAILSQARHLRAWSYQEAEAWAEAAPLWEAILADPREKSTERGRILFYLGWCYRNLHRPVDAARLWEQAGEQGGEVSQAAALRLAQLRLETGQRSAALPLYERALNGVTKPEDYHNSLVDLAQARQLLETACRVQWEAGNFDNAYKLALLQGRLVPQEPGQLLLAQVTEAWASAQREQAQSLKNREAARGAEEGARTYFREAGRAYEAAALASLAPASKINWLWRASQDYLQGHDFVHAIAVLEGLLKVNLPLERQGEAWFHLGEAHQALGDSRQAAISYRRCIGYEGPYAYRARYELAVAEIKQGRVAEAEDFLRQNLELMQLEPDREAHEKSLYALADLLYLRHDYRMASHRWEMALMLYPTDPTAWTARYRLGDCYRHLADVECQGLRPGEPFAAATHGHHRKQYTLWLERAGANYQKVADDLEARQTAGLLTQAEAALLRQAQFALADCRFDQAQFALADGRFDGRNFDEAVRLYNKLAQRYPDQVDGLKAVRGLYRCYVVLVIPPDLNKAAATLQLALSMLNTLEDSAFRGLPETDSRAAWEQWHKRAVDDVRRLSP